MLLQNVEKTKVEFFLQELVDQQEIVLTQLMIFVNYAKLKLAITDNVSEITARTNDEGFETIFDQYLITSNLVKMIFYLYSQLVEKL